MDPTKPTQPFQPITKPFQGNQPPVQPTQPVVPSSNPKPIFPSPVTPAPINPKPEPIQPNINPVQIPSSPPPVINPMPSNQPSKDNVLTPRGGSKNVILIVGLIFLCVVILLALGYFLLFKNKASSGSGNTLSPTPTVPFDSWKVFSNETYGFSFKYPQSLTEQEPISGLTTQEGFFVFKGSSEKETINLNVVAYTGSVDELAAAYEKDHMLFGRDLGDLGLLDSRQYEKNVDYAWYKKAVTAQLEDNEVTINVTNILFVNGGYGYVLNTQRTDDTELKQIISTFKFTPKAEPSEEGTTT